MNNYLKFLYLVCFILFTNISFSQNPLLSSVYSKQIQKYLEQKQFNFSNEDIADLYIDNEYFAKKTSITHIYIGQKYKGIKIFNAISSIAIKNGKIIYFGNSFVNNIGQKINAVNRSISPQQAIQKVSAHLNLGVINDLKELKSANNNFLFSKANVSKKEIPVNLVFTKTFDGKLKLSWDLNIHTTDSKHVWNAKIDAITGDILEYNDLVLRCDFGAPNHSINDFKKTIKNSKEVPFSLVKSTNYVTAIGSQYNVFALPNESPNHNSRQLVIDPANNTASPYGWHDTNGAPGAEHTITRGNNVHAYEDQAGNNSIGFSPDGGANLNFDFTLDFNNPIGSDTSTENRSSSITNLFYLNNIIHDILYQYGFDEVAGNFQQNNYGNGGAENDYVLAEAQDGSGTDNANFLTLSDGTSPRMQMYLWTGGGSLSSFTVNSPGSIAGIYTSQGALFGPSTYNVTGNLVLADDGSSIPSEACDPLINGGAINGNIAVIDRGNCEFGLKCLNAQNAGAVAVVVINNVVGSPIAMSPGVDGAAVTIPCLMISQADGVLIRAQLPDVNVTLTGTPIPSELDGDFDNGIVVHEYGHGVSTRLTGGPNSSCLSGDEQQGEGWSDYISLMLTTDFSASNKNDARPIGTYASAQNTSGGGIRTFPYSYDLGINPHTYTDIETEVAPHGVGSVWCALLWDLTWNLIDIEGIGTNDIYFGSTNANRGGGQNIAFQLVMEGLKLQGCDPTFVSSRDAILAADEANYDGDYQCIIWETFARRGVGFSADAGTAASKTDQTVAFDMPTSDKLNITTSSVASAIEGQTLTYTITTKNKNCDDITAISIEDILPLGLTYINSSASNGGSLNGGTITYPSVSNMVFKEELTYTFDAKVDVGAYAANFPTILFPINDDVESGTGVWDPSNGSPVFKISTDFPNSDNSSWFAPNSATAKDFTLTSASLLLEGCSKLTFNHSYNFEKTWDGGTIEISTDGGSSWQNLSAAISQNPYPNIIAVNSGTSLAGEGAFTGNSNGYVETIVDLCEYSGQNVMIRFHVASDTNTAATGDYIGWYIDDIVVQNNAGLINTAIATFNAVSSVSSHCLVITQTLAYHEENEFEALNVYPNPTNGLLIIKNSIPFRDVKISIHDVMGRVLSNEIIVNKMTNNELSINISHFVSGAYFLTIENEKHKSTKGIIKN